MGLDSGWVGPSARAGVLPLLLLPWGSWGWRRRFWGLSVSACPVQSELAQEELFVAVEMLSAVAQVNQALDARNPNRLWSSLVSPALGLSGAEDANAQR